MPDIQPQDTLSSRADHATDEIANLFRLMCRIRHTENSLLKLFSLGKLSGTTHTCIGQEAIAAALSDSLGREDIVFSTHRCHGHFLARGGALVELLAEIMGRQSALCLGRGGSQHLHEGNFYSNGVQGGVVGNATGMALAEKLTGGERVTVAFLGDGTLGEGLVYESLNFASLMSLPILYILEDNQYAQSTPASTTVSGSMAGRAAAFGIESEEIQSNDALELIPVMKRCVERVRQQRPMLLIVHTYRLAPHSKGDDNRDPAELERWWQLDPLLVMRRKLPSALAEEIERRAEEEVATAIADAEKVPFPMAGTNGPLCTIPANQLPVPWPRDNITYVQSINDALLQALASDPRCFVIGEDIVDPYGGAFKATRGCSTRFPNRTIAAPISEAGIVAWSTGAAMRGLRPVAEIMFGDFLTLAADQILNHASKYRWVYGEKVSVPLVIRTPMGGRRGYGPTHSQSIEAMFFGVPGLSIVAPSHLLDPGELLRRCISLTSDPVLFIENKLLYGQRLLVPQNGRIGRFFVRATTSCFPTLRLSLSDVDAPDMTLITYGGSVPFALEAAERLLIEQECLCDLVVPSLIAPLPHEEIKTFLGGVRKIAVFEEGVKRAGWGAELLASLVEERGSSSARQYLRIGAPASPLPSSKSLERDLLPDADYLVRTLGAWARTSP